MKKKSVAIDPRKNIVKQTYAIMRREVDDLLDALCIDNDTDVREYDPKRISEILKIQGRTLEEREKVATASAGGVLRGCLTVLLKNKIPMRFRNKRFEETLVEYRTVFESLSENS